MRGLLSLGMAVILRGVARPGQGHIDPRDVSAKLLHVVGEEIASRFNGDLAFVCNETRSELDVRLDRIEHR